MHAYVCECVSARDFIYDYWYESRLIYAMNPNLIKYEKNTKDC